MNTIVRNTRQCGNVLHRIRRRLKLTQKGMGDKVRMRQATISGLESGRPGIRLRTFFDILAALDQEIVIRPRTRSRDNRRGSHL